jgi:5-(carboxyamino)imidazole ribonucleotide synthase
MPRDIAFRDALRADPELVRQYADLKWSITAGGEVEGYRYTHSKTAWIASVYRRLGFAFGFPPVLPPATIGILGGGQLGRMLGLAARELGYRVAVLDPDPACPASAVADRVEVGRYDDVDAAKRLADGCGVVTYELEHVAEAVVKALDDGSRPVRPGLHPLKVTQDRLAERRFLEANEAPVAPWREVAGDADLDAAVAGLGFPLRLKVAIGGYDGRNQIRLAGPQDLPAVRAMLATAAGPMLLERELAFASELSVIVARSFDGAIAPFAPAANVHDAGILVESAAPAPVPPGVSDAATELATRLATAMGLIGLLTVEMFRMPDDSLVVNELAPRVHNSGHWTIEAAVTSQFEQQVRAICGLPLGSPALRSGAAATVNVLGAGASREARLEGVPDALGEPDVHLHLYDKRTVFERRKMGHVTALADDVESALARAREARAKLRWLE